MELVDIVPKDLHILVDISFQDLLKLKTILDNMVFNFDGENKLHIDADTYLREVLYPNINSIIKGIEDGNSADFK